MATLRARTERSSRDGSGIPTRRTAALSGAAARPDTAVAGLPPTPDPAIRMLQKSVQGYCRQPPWGDLYESGLALFLPSTRGGFIEHNLTYRKRA